MDQNGLTHDRRALGRRDSFNTKLSCSAQTPAPPGPPWVLKLDYLARMCLGTKGPPWTSFAPARLYPTRSGLRCPAVVSQTFLADARDRAGRLEWRRQNHFASSPDPSADRPRPDRLDHKACASQ